MRMLRMEFPPYELAGGNWISGLIDTVLVPGKSGGTGIVTGFPASH